MITRRRRRRATLTVASLVAVVAVTTAVDAQPAGAVPLPVNIDGFQDGFYVPIDDVVLGDAGDASVVANGNLAVTWAGSTLEPTFNEDDAADGVRFRSRPARRPHPRVGGRDHRGPRRQPGGAHRAVDTVRGRTGDRHALPRHRRPVRRPRRGRRTAQPGRPVRRQRRHLQARRAARSERRRRSRATNPRSASPTPPPRWRSTPESSWTSP